MGEPKFLVFGGSLRKASWNKKLARIVADEVRVVGAQATLIDLRDYELPIYDEDLETENGLPVNARKLKDLFIGHEGFLLSCPEYNSSLTPVLKNTLDWVSRPAPGEAPLAAFKSKIAGLFAASPGALGGLRGLVAVRALLGNVGTIVMPSQVAISKAHEAFDDGGRLKDQKLHAQVTAAVKEAVEVGRKMGGSR